VVVFFSAEYVLRFLVTDHKLQFLYQPLNVIDIVSILPTYLTYFIEVKCLPVRRVYVCIFAFPFSVIPATDFRDPDNRSPRSREKVSVIPRTGFPRSREKVSVIPGTFFLRCFAIIAVRAGSRTYTQTRQHACT